MGATPPQKNNLGSQQNVGKACCYNKTMHHQLIYHPHETLSKRAEAVDVFDGTLKGLLKDMRAVMNTKQGVGIAAPQVGVSLRCFHAKFQERIYTFVNPRITSFSSERSVHEEGCLSIPGVYADVTRPAALHIDAYDAKGRAFSMDVEGFLARIIQHEYDHLEGVLFIDIISRTARRMALKVYQKPEGL